MHGAEMTLRVTTIIGQDTLTCARVQELTHTHTHTQTFALTHTHTHTHTHTPLGY